MKQQIEEYIKANLGIDDRETIDMLYDSYKEMVAENIGKIEKAIVAGNAVDLAFSAHALKGGSANIGAEDIRALCYEMELSGKRGEIEFSKNSFPRLKELQSRLE